MKYQFKDEEVYYVIFFYDKDDIDFSEEIEWLSDHSIPYETTRGELDSSFATFYEIDLKTGFLKCFYYSNDKDLIEAFKHIKSIHNERKVSKCENYM